MPVRATIGREPAAHKRLKYIGTVPERASLSASIVVFYDSVGGHVRFSGLDPYRMLADTSLLEVVGSIPARSKGGLFHRAEKASQSGRAFGA